MTRRPLPAALFSLSVAIVSAAPATGQCNDWTVPAGGSFNGAVYELEPFQGDVYATGAFNAVAGQPANQVARWDGTAWHPLGTGIGGDIPMARVLKSWNGNLYVGGQFIESAGGVPLNALARWDGTKWDDVNIAMVGDGQIVTTMMEWEGDLLVGGSFSPQNLGMVSLARWNGVTWSPVSIMPPQYQMCYALASFDGRLYAAFRNWPGPEGARDFIAMWDGEEWQTIGVANDWIRELLVYGDHLIVAGGFTEIDGIPLGRIAKWDGAAWASLDEGITAPGLLYIYGLAVYHGELVAAGRFNSIGGVSNTKNIAAWNATTGTWRHFHNEGHTTDGATTYYGLLVHEGRLFAGGNFRPQPVGREYVMMFDGCVPCCLVGLCFNAISGHLCYVSGGTHGHALDTCAIGCTLGTCCLPWGCEAWSHVDCIDLGGQFLGIGVSCLQCPPGNDSCVYAFDIECGEIATGSTINASWDAAPFCIEPNTSKGVWYRLVGGGQFVTASLCSDGNSYDTRLSVYTDGCGTLTCVTGDDDACPLFRSRVTFVAEVDVEYLILVHGYDQGTGNYELLIQCVDPITIPDDAIDEGEPCGSSFNAGCNNELEQFAELRLGDTIHGTAWAFDGVRDTDWYYLDLLEPTTIHLSAIAELPFRIGIIGGQTQPGSGSCDGILAFIHTVAGNAATPLQLSAELEAGTWMVWAGPNVFNGFPCGTFNNYVLSITCDGCPEPIGACCLDSGCMLLTAGDCAASRGNYLGDNTSCCDCPATAFTPSLSVLIRAGDVLDGYGEVTNVLDVAVNDEGEWIAIVVMNSGQRVLVRNGLPWLATGDAVDPAPSTIANFGPASGLNNEGLLAMNLSLIGLPGSGVYLEGAPLIVRDDIATSPQLSENTPWIGFFHTRMDDHGRIRLIGTVNDPALPGTVHRTISWLTPGTDPGVLHETTIFKRYDSAPGLPIGVTFDAFGTSAQTGAINNRSDVLFTADFNGVGDPSTNGGIFLNRQLLHRRGDDAPIAGLTLSNIGANTAVDLNDSRDYLFRTNLANAAPGTNQAIIRNGFEVVARLGDPVDGTNGAPLTAFSSGPLFLSNNCRSVWFGRWEDDGAALFVDDTAVLVAGETIVRGDLVTVVGATTGVGGAALGYDASDNGRYIIARVQLNGMTPAVVLTHLGTEGLAPPCPADLNGDGVVNSTDLLELLSAWGPCPGCPADLNNDGVVNSSDLLELLGAWGQCPSE